MRKIKIALIGLIMLLALSSCADEEAEHGYNILDALRISVWLFDENIDMSEPIDYNPDTAFHFERLRLNEVRVMAPVTVRGGIRGMPEGGATDKYGLSLHIAYNGIIEVVAEDENVLLSRNNNLTPHFSAENTRESGRVAGFSAKLPREGFVNMIPFSIDSLMRRGFSGDLRNNLRAGGAFAPTHFVSPFIVGEVYYVTVNAYRDEAATAPRITAQLRLVVLEQAPEEGLEWAHNPAYSSVFSIEMVSYEFSDVYRFRYDIWDED